MNAIRVGRHCAHITWKSRTFWDTAALDHSDRIVNWFQVHDVLRAWYTRPVRDAVELSGRTPFAARADVTTAGDGVTVPSAVGGVAARRPAEWHRRRQRREPEPCTRTAAYLCSISRPTSLTLALLLLSFSSSPRYCWTPSTPPGPIRASRFAHHLHLLRRRSTAQITCRPHSSADDNAATGAGRGAGGWGTKRGE